MSGSSIGKQTTVIYYVSALLWTISWPSNVGNPGDFIVKFKSIVKHGLTQGKVVLVLHQQHKIIQNGGGRVHILTAEVPIPPETSILGVTKNKVQLNKDACWCHDGLRVA